jgi:F-type H+-transporting ATPase subunit delta
VADKNISRIFAESLSEVGKAENVLPVLEEELRTVLELFQEEKDLGKYFDSHEISREKKKEFIGTLFSGKLSDYVTNMLKSIINFDCMIELDEIYSEFVKQVDLINNRQRITVTTRFEIDDSTRDKIKSALSKKLKKDIILKESINEKILGGIIIQIDDLLIDGSVANHLKKIKHNLIISKVGSDAAYED